MFAWSKTAEYFLQADEKVQVHEAVKNCEAGNAGELRVFIEGKCKLMDPLERAGQIFADLKMHQTEQHSAVLIYVAYKHKEFAIYGDSNCVAKFPGSFWAAQARLLHKYFAQEEYVRGLQQCIANVNEQFMLHFKSDSARKNELPDEIIFGK